MIRCAPLLGSTPQYGQVEQHGGAERASSASNRGSSGTERITYPDRQASDLPIRASVPASVSVYFRPLQSHREGCERGPDGRVLREKHRSATFTLKATLIIIDGRIAKPDQRLGQARKEVLRLGEGSREPLR